LLAGHLAATLSASSLVTQLRRQARQDHLTGLGNRAALDEFLDGHQGHDRGPSIAVLLDLDHFKSVNDRLGHVVGDDALRTMAAHLSDRLGNVRLFRYGGDEFALFLHSTDADDALELVSELCETGRSALAPFGCSITAGLAADRWAEDTRGLFARADAALVWAKSFARGTATLAGSYL
jgi:diguanylate cyclase (GGDEF)-like protein